MAALKTIKLPGDNELKVYQKSIVVAGRTIYFARQVDKKDVEVLQIVFALGVAAKARQVAELMTKITEPSL